MDQKTNTRTQPTQGHQGQQRPDRDQNRDSQEPNNDRDQAEGSRDRGGASDMGGQARDAGRTSGGGNLGHDQPSDLSEQTDIRNATTERRPDSSAKDRQAGRLAPDPVMPEDDATLKTQI